jgi:hypothetical protein
LRECRAEIQRQEEERLYMDNGGVGSEAQLQPEIDEMISALKMKG